MNRKRALLGVALAVLGALETAKAALGAVPERLANPDAFCLRAFSAMVANDDSRTVIVSPESLSTALMMLALGARGETAAEFDRAFEVRSGEMYEATKLHIARTQALMAADPRIDFRTANGLFVERNLKLKPEYVVKITGDFKARVETLDFGAPAVRIINRWFNDETKGLIPEMLKELTPVMRLVLANAIYFKGKWSVAFDAKNTEPHPFKTASGAMRPVQMMFHPNQSLAYRETPWFQTVKLPYGEGGYEAVVLLPWRGREIATWLSPEKT
jgi:serpin B